MGQCMEESNSLGADVDRRPLPELSQAVVDFLAALRAGGLGVKPCPQLFPNWELEIRLLPTGV